MCFYSTPFYSPPFSGLSNIVDSLTGFKWMTLRMGLSRMGWSKIQFCIKKIQVEFFLLGDGLWVVAQARALKFFRRWTALPQNSQAIDKLNPDQLQTNEMHGFSRANGYGILIHIQRGIHVCARVHICMYIFTRTHKTHRCTCIQPYEYNHILPCTPEPSHIQTISISMSIHITVSIFMSTSMTIAA